VNLFQGAGHIVKSVGNLALIGATSLCIFPILQKFPTQPTIVKIVDHWQLPTASEVHLIIKQTKLGRDQFSGAYHPIILRPK